MELGGLVELAGVDSCLVAVFVRIFTGFDLGHAGLLDIECPWTAFYRFPHQKSAHRPDEEVSVA